MSVGDPVEEHGEAGCITVKRAKPNPVTLEWLIEGITPKNRHEETDFGPPVGRELW
ncbi:MAG: hypothetical protein AVDCRST_MAG91-2750 [uncultured Sphingomonadaceae bacterium]|uniref:SpoVT-AbrB domain-containing protein n=1 Tax=uncultured Sphingomonadaceae bacterium TaxID=169976 RepID=A0A6J4TQ40_9SPHN|nr:MAG: hypothetical protein AVDCRST_MAG91-2750 [uncultured Sphingomonadaceae bacterium]